MDINNIKDIYKTLKDMEQDKKDNLELLESKFFENNNDLFFLYKKIQKLTAAIYMVTNIFGDMETVKWTIRERATNLLSFIINHKDNDNLSFINSIKIKVLDIISLLQVSSIAGLISEMNFSILKQEYSNLMAILNNSKTSFFAIKSLSSEFFGIPKLRSEATLVDKGHFFNNIVKDNYDKVIDKSSKRTNRQSFILDLLKKKKELNIKDISQVIRGCSEKTIQRELTSFIKAGIVRKFGQRRWSRYSLSE